MLKKIILLGAGTAAAVYFLDEKKGKKRRARFKKQVQRYANVAGERLSEYSEDLGHKASRLSHQVGPRVTEWSRNVGSAAGNFTHDFGNRAQHYVSDAGTAVADYMKNGTGRWTPSARLIGAVGSALAFYGAGRRGMAGSVLRTLSLGLFTRALMAPR